MLEEKPQAALFNLTTSMDTSNRVSIVTSVSVTPQCIEELHRLCCESSALLDLVTDAIVLWALDGTVKFWNRSAERMYGWSVQETIGQPVGKFLDRLDSLPTRAAMAQTLTVGEWMGELNLTTKAGKSIEVSSHWYAIPSASGAPLSILSIDTDISQYKLLERQFLRTQRLENLGMLASGIAHDLNNILTPIVSITELLPLKLPQLDDRCRKLIDTLAQNSQRGRELIAQILDFAKGGDGERSLVQPRHLLLQVLQIIRQTFPRSIEISLQIENRDLWTLSADASQLYQVILNLGVNARDAMPDGGQLTLVAENIILTEEYAKLHARARSGAYVAIAVADTGSGVPPELLEQIFEPFFTTKESGKGTGLGLSTVATIVHNHQGFIDVVSKVGKGTQFRCYLPANDRAAVLPDRPVDVIPLVGRGEGIAIVDDEPSIREILGTTLEAYDYRIFTAGDTQQAIELYTDRHGEIQTILLDYMMPGGETNETIERLLAIDPDLKIIIMSGLSAEEIDTSDCGERVCAFLPKPFSRQDLLHTLKTTLN